MSVSNFEHPERHSEHEQVENRRKIYFKVTSSQISSTSNHQPAFFCLVSQCIWCYSSTKAAVKHFTDQETPGKSLIIITKMSIRHEILRHSLITAHPWGGVCTWFIRFLTINDQCMHVWSSSLPLFALLALPACLSFPGSSWEGSSSFCFFCFFGEGSHGCRSDQFRLTSLHSWTDRRMKAEQKMIVAREDSWIINPPVQFLCALELISQPVSIFPPCGLRNKQDRCPCYQLQISFRLHAAINSISRRLLRPIRFSNLCPVCPFKSS